MTITGLMLLSSLVGYLSISFSMAGFIPTIGQNYEQRAVANHPAFIIIWLIADMMNLVATVELKPQSCQYTIAAWYGLVDICLTIQLAFYGYDGPGWFPYNKKHRLKRRDRTDRQLTIAVGLGHWVFGSFIILLLSCVAFNVAQWGIFFMLQAYFNPNYSIPIPIVTPPSATILGYISQLTSASSRFIELFHGWHDYFRPSKYQKKPSVSVHSYLFWALIMEQALQLSSIFLLSTGPAYLSAQRPWITGACVSISADTILLISSTLWNNKWENSQRFKDLEGKAGPVPGDPGHVPFTSILEKRKLVAEKKHAFLEEEESLDELLYDEVNDNNATYADHKAVKLPLKKPDKAKKLTAKTVAAENRHADYVADRHSRKERRRLAAAAESARIERNGVPEPETPERIHAKKVAERARLEREETQRQEKRNAAAAKREQRLKDLAPLPPIN